MNNYENAYKYLLKQILRDRFVRNTRTGQCLVLFNTTITVDLQEGFPMLTGRKMYWKTVKGEAEWMLSGSTNVKDLHKLGIHIWDKWANSEGELGPTYGFELRRQWANVVKILMTEPESRRCIINLWNVDNIDKMALPPCYHTLQFYVTGYHLNLTVSSRSSDAAVGLPYDIAVLSYLLHKMCEETCFSPGKLTFNSCNTHINLENEEAVEQYIQRQTHLLPFIEYGELLGYSNSGTLKMIVKP